MNAPSNTMARTLATRTSSVDAVLGAAVDAMQCDKKDHVRHAGTEPTLSFDQTAVHRRRPSVRSGGVT